MLESRIVDKITAFLKTVDNCWFFKVHGNPMQKRGVPDIIGCFRGLFFAFEVKTPDGVLTRLQEERIRQIKKSGGFVYVVRSLDEVKTIIQELSALASYENHQSSEPPDA